MGEENLTRLQEEGLSDIIFDVFSKTFARRYKLRRVCRRRVSRRRDYERWTVVPQTSSCSFGEASVRVSSCLCVLEGSPSFFFDPLLFHCVHEGNHDLFVEGLGQRLLQGGAVRRYPPAGTPQT